MVWLTALCRKSLYCLLLGLTSSTLGIAQEKGLLSQAFFRDATGLMTFSEVESAPFTPYTGMLTRGFDPGAIYWLKLGIPASQDSSVDWVLRILPSWHDDLQLFDPADQGSGARRTGDLHPWADSEFPSLGLSFRLVGSPEARDVYLRLQSIHSYQIQTGLLEWMQAEQSEWRRILLVSLYLTAMAILLLWALSALLVQWDWTLVLFALTQLIALIYSFLMLGMARALLDEFIPNTWIHQVHALSVMLYPIAAMQFHCKLLRNAVLKNRWGLLLTLASTVPVAALVLYLFGQPARALSLNSLGILVFPVVSFVTVWLGLSRLQGDGGGSLLPRWSLRIFFSLTLMVGLLGAGPLLGWIQASNQTMWILLLHGPMLTAMIGGLMLYRSRELGKAQARELAIASARLEEERIARAQQSQLIAMINHEIKTPMSVLKFLVAGQANQSKAEAQVDTVVALLDRCLLLEKLNDREEQACKEAFHAQAIVQHCIDKTAMASRFTLELDAIPAVQSDSVLYSVIVSNLLDNALKYAESDSMIEVGLRETLDEGTPRFCFSVTNLMGRAGAPDLSRVYEKYYRADSARFIPGTGLGLHLVQSLVKRLGGEIRCTIEGTLIRFQVWLPR